MAVLLAPALASAHAQLETAVPAVGSTVTHAPAELRLDFSEALEPTFSKIAVTGPSGASVVAGDLRTDADDARHVRVPLLKLMQGTYTVVWHAVSVDTHRTQGSYRFTVAP